MTSTQRGFPNELLGLVCCTRDGGALNGLGQPASIVDGTIHCSLCGHGYRIESGILRLLDSWEPDEESAHEARLRDSIAGNGDYVEQFRVTATDRKFDRMEMRPTLAALAPLRGGVVLELGAGTGRYTVELVKESRAVLAVDFSARSLETLAAKLCDPRQPGGARVGLVQADVTLLRLAPRAFDRILSTLASNLPTRAHRAAMYLLAAGALREDGLFAFSAHHHGLRQRLLRAPVDGRYSEGGIYRRFLTERELLGELRPYFQQATCRPIQIALPFTYRWPGFPLEAVSRLAEWSPFIKGLGFLLLATACRPVEPSTVPAPATPTPSEDRRHHSRPAAQ